MGNGGGGPHAICSEEQLAGKQAKEREREREKGKV